MMAVALETLGKQLGPLLQVLSGSEGAEAGAATRAGVRLGHAHTGLSLPTQVLRGT